MRDWNTSWVPPPVPGGDQFTPPAPPPDSGSGDWSWLSNDPTSSVSAWHEWLGHVPQELQSFFANFAPTPEQELADAIYKKMGPAAGARSPHSPDPNMHIAQLSAHAAMQSPAYREQLVQSLGWNAKNSHVAFWIQQGGAIPADPTGTGAGTPPPGGTTTTTGGGTTASGAIAGSPFDPKAWAGRGKDPGFTYGQALPPQFAAAAGVSNQWGVDYALPLGTQLPSPFTGTIQSAGWDGPYGNTVVVKLANGFTYRVAHLSAINAHVGDSIAVGSLLGLVGSTGNSTGPHVLIEIHDAQGKPIDPTAIIDNLLKGDPSTANKILGDFASAATGPGTSGGSVKTSDGFLFYAGTPDFNVFVAAATLWRKRYGGDPPGQFVRGLIAAGNTTAEQIQNQMDLMTSDISSMNWGQRDQLTTDANAAATKAFSRPLPDSTVKQLAGEGITTSAQLQLWAESHPAAAIDNADRVAIYDKVNLQTQKYWDQPPSPDMVAEIHKRMKQGPQ